MVEAPGINLRITNIYKYFLYVGAIILILSLFFDVKGIDPSIVRSFSVWILISGSCVWFVDDVIGYYADYKEMKFNVEEAGKQPPYGFEDTFIGVRVVKSIFRFIMVATAAYFLSWLI